jgi:hypothetical protein
MSLNTIGFFHNNQWTIEPEIIFTCTKLYFSCFSSGLQFENFHFMSVREDPGRTVPAIGIVGYFLRRRG